MPRMARRTLKDYLPRSLYGRAFAILVLPVILLQVVLTVVLLQRHFEQVSAQMSVAAAREISFVRDAWRAGEEIGRLGISIARTEAGIPDDSWPFYDFTGATIAETLRAEIPEARALVMGQGTDAALWLEFNGQTVVATFPRERLSARNPHQLLVILLISGIVVTVIAFLFLRNQLRPIRRLAHAATEFGRGRVLPLTPAGATEVRAAATAFLDMRARIERQKQTRTMMLSGVSHDLRTPLTRLRLGLALMDEASAEPLRRDVDDMERLLDGFLDYARDSGADPSEPLALEPWLKDCVERVARSGPPVSLRIDGRLPETVLVRPIALQRALTNLIENARRYGSEILVTARGYERSFALIVEDDGPGIPPEQRDEALKPFARLDPSRNQNSGPGVGLGLAIVSDIARLHGGTIRLGESQLGGLKAEIIIPL